MHFCYGYAFGEWRQCINEYVLGFLWERFVYILFGYLYAV